MLILKATMVSKQASAAPSRSNLLKPILLFKGSQTYGKMPTPIPILDSHLVDLRFLLSIPVIPVGVVRIPLRKMKVSKSNPRSP